MARTKTTYVCSDCGATTPKWQGQCPDCEAWNTLNESQPVAPKAARGGGYAGAAGNVRRLSDVENQPEPRIDTGLKELDRVLGGGLVPGSVSLIGGEPGIGKSTLLLQAGAVLSKTLSTLYVSGEESLRQIGLRARRLDLGDVELNLLAETCVEKIVAEAVARKPGVLVVDSIQTMYSDGLQAAPGTVSQLRECAAQLVRLAKLSGMAVFLVGHVTKEGVIAGPRVLEHMVDTVLYFESDAGSRYRIVRAAKNRFGAANEIGVFAMTDTGLKEVKNPSAIFLSQHSRAVAGSAIMVSREGSRPLLVEVQALASDTSGNPRRVSVGLEPNRLVMLLAVLARHGNVPIGGQDVFVNVVGGVRVSETAVDLPLLLAVLSSYRDRPLEGVGVAFGEVGLAGEIRPVPFGEERLLAAAKQGFKRAIVPTANAPRKAIKGLEVLPVDSLAQALEIATG
ncbi:MAG: DNA repair protein RadA [Gammaproteobacteria bacterium]